ncbi:MAG: DUF2062 domain-containing protein [Verrucomicrobiota bacterium]
MTAEEHHLHLRERFARIRRAKFFLRFMPRRARFHTYPVIGRFAAFARKRSYLWSFRSSEVRPAIYVGSVLAFMPVPGLQLVLAFALAVLLRRNVMVLAGLQFLTNPLTLPVFIATHQIGMTVIESSGFGRSIEPAEEQIEITGHDFSETPVLRPVDPPPPEPSGRLHRWTSGVGTQINAFIIGGVIVGLVTAAVIDLLWVISVRQAEVHRRKVRLRRAIQTHAEPSPPEKPTSVPDSRPPA